MAQVTKLAEKPQALTSHPAWPRARIRANWMESGEGEDSAGQGRPGCMGIGDEGQPRLGQSRAKARAKRMGFTGHPRGRVLSGERARGRAWFGFG